MHSRVGIFKNTSGNIPSGNFPGGNSPEGSLIGRNFPGRTFPDTEILAKVKAKYGQIREKEMLVTLNFACW